MQLFINLGNMYEALGNAYDSSKAKIIVELLYDSLYKGNTTTACNVLREWKQDCIENSQVCKHLRDTMNNYDEIKTPAEAVRSANWWNWKIRYYGAAANAIDTVINDLTPFE